MSWDVVELVQVVQESRSALDTAIGKRDDAIATANAMYNEVAGEARRELNAALAKLGPLVPQRGDKVRALWGPLHKQQIVTIGRTAFGEVYVAVDDALTLLQLELPAEAPPTAVPKPVEIVSGQVEGPGEVLPYRPLHEQVANDIDPTYPGAPDEATFPGALGA